MTQYVDPFENDDLNDCRCRECARWWTTVEILYTLLEAAQFVEDEVEAREVHRKFVEATTTRYGVIRARAEAGDVNAITLLAKASQNGILL